MKNGKSLGPRIINLELFNYGEQTELLNTILKGDDIPEQMKIGYMVPIHKERAEKQRENYRGIIITPAYKMFK